MPSLKSRVQVNARFFQLKKNLKRFLAEGINPEIGLFARDLDDFSAKDFAAVAEALRKADLRPTVHGPFLDLAPGSPDPDALAVTMRRFEQLVRAAEAIRPRSVTCHLDYRPWQHVYYREFWLEQSLKTWRWLAGRLGDLGVRLMLENTFEREPGEMLPALSELRGLGVGWCLDVGHLNLFSAVSRERWIEQMGPMLGQMHLHDNFGGRDDHLPLGEGSIDFPPLFALLGTLPEPLTVTLEVGADGLTPSLPLLEEVWPWN